MCCKDCFRPLGKTKFNEVNEMINSHTLKNSVPWISPKVQ